MELQSLPDLLARKNLKADTTFWLGIVRLSDNASTIWMQTRPNGQKITFLVLHKDKSTGIFQGKAAQGMKRYPFICKTKQKIEKKYDVILPVGFDDIVELDNGKRTNYRIIRRDRNLPSVKV